MTDYRQFLEEQLEKALDPFIEDYDVIEPSEEFYGSEPSNLKVTATSDQNPQFNFMATYESSGEHMNEYEFTARGLLIEEEGEIKNSRRVIRGLSEGEFPEEDITKHINDALSEIF